MRNQDGKLKAAIYIHMKRINYDENKINLYLKQKKKFENLLLKLNIYIIFIYS